MSRLRSQLDNIFSDNGQGDNQDMNVAPKPAYQQPIQSQPVAPRHATTSNPVQNQNLDNIQVSLDRLASKLSSFSSAATTQTKHGQDGGLQKFQNDFMGELRSGFQQLRHDLAEVKTASNTDPQDDLLNGEIRRIADGIELLQQSQGVHPDYLNQMNTELQNLRSGIDQLNQRPQPQLDLSVVASSIETGYAEIAGKLDAFLDKPSQSVSDAVNFDKQMRQMTERVEEVTRAVVTLSVSPEADQESFSRIENQILDLSKSVGQIAEAGSQQVAMPEVDLEPLALQIGRLSEKLDNISAMNGVSDHLVADFEGVTQRLDALQSDFNNLTAHLATFENRDADQVGNSYENIENSLIDIAARIDQFAVGETTSSATDGEEILGILRDLVAKVDNIPSSATAVAAPNPEIADLGSLEAQLAGIASQLGNFQPTFDAQPISDRLDNIESQIAASRDIVMDLVGQAVAKVGGVDQVGNIDDGKIGQITDSLSLISQRLDDLEVNSDGAVRQEETVRHNLASTYTQPEFDTSFTDENAELTDEIAETAPQQPVEDNFEPAHNFTDNTQTPLLHEEVDQHADYGDIEDAPSMDMSADIAHDFDEYNDDNSSADVNAQAAISEHSENVSAEMETGQIVEDVPLEPGSGMPDLEALVRSATKRKIQETEEVDSSTSDLIAAARRAAQASALQSQMDAEVASQKPKAAKIPKLGKPNLPSFIGKKALLASVAIIALGLGAYKFAPKIMSLVSPPAVTSTTEKMGAEEITPAAGEATTDIVTSEPGSELNANEADLVVEEVPTTEMAADSGAADMMKPESGTDAAVNTFVKSDAATANSEQQIAQPVKAEADVPMEIDASATSMVPPKDVGNQALQQAAASGDGNALFEIGRRYTDGDGVERNLEEAVKWYETAAAGGHVPSQYRIGNFYEKGHGVAADPAKAAVWYTQAAEKGNALAMHNLAVLNAMGVINGDPDMDKAIGLFTKAADLGVKDSQVNLGILYTKGMGVSEDLEKAYQWFAIASRAGDQDAAKKRDTVAAAMRPEQLEKARAAAEAWKPQPLLPAVNIAQVDPQWGNKAPQKQMSKQEIIKQTQSMLAKAGFDPGPADGVFGLKTRDAIISFQKKIGVEQNGEISAELLDKLSKVSI